MAFRYPPSPIGNSWKDWASQLVSYLKERDVDATTEARAIQLEHKIGSAARATSDGVILYDPLESAIVVSVGGAWLNVLNSSHIEVYHDPAGTASWRLDHVSNTLECWGYATLSTTGVTVTYPKTYASAAAVRTTVTPYVTATPIWLATHQTQTATSFLGQLWNSAGTQLTSGGFTWYSIGEWDGVS